MKKIIIIVFLLIAIPLVIFLISHFQKGLINPGDQNLTQDFQWGVLIMNTAKSSYAPGETVQVRMAVLYPTGFPNCNADLTLQITNPSGKVTRVNSDQIIKSQFCEFNRTSKPSFYSDFKADQIGRYKLDLTAKNLNKSKEITEYIKVENNESIISTRGMSDIMVYPDSYSVGILIKASQDINGTISETVPSSLKVTPEKNSGSIKKNGDNMELSWNINLRKGEEKQLQYSIKKTGAEIGFGIFGPLMFNGNPIEERGWMVGL